MNFERHLERFYDGLKLKITREVERPSPICALCGVKLILNEVNSMMCVKCSSENNKRIKEGVAPLETDLEIKSKAPVEEKTKPSLDSQTNQAVNPWDKLENSLL